MTEKNRTGVRYVAKSGANGSAVAASEPSSITTTLGHHLGRAGSVDASELSVANAAVPTAAGADREATADLAAPKATRRSRASGTACGANGSAKAAPQSRSENRARRPKRARAATSPSEVGPGLEPLPVDAEAFVDAVHSQVDLVQLEVTLLRSKDDKIVQRELACLRELRYGKRAPAEDSEPQIIVDMQRPERDIP